MRVNQFVHGVASYVIKKTLVIHAVRKREGQGADKKAAYV